MKSAKMKLLLAGAATLAFALSGMAQANAAQNNDNSADTPSQTATSDGQQTGVSDTQQNQPPYQNENAGEQTVEGQITGFRHVNLHPKNAPEKNCSFVRLHLSNGQDVIVDVGPKNKLDRLNLAAGDQLTAQGQYQQVAGQDVLVASQLEVNGQTVDVERAQENPANILTGEIEGFHNLAVQGGQGEQENQTLAKLRLDNGQIKILDLGPQERLSSLELQKGDRIRVRTEKGTLDNRPILLANRIQDLSRNEIGREAAGAANGEGNEVTVKGRVRGYQVWTIEDGGQPMAVLNLQLQNGKSIFVGSDPYHPGEFDLRQLALGDEVKIKAHEAQDNNGPQMIADSIQFKPPGSHSKTAARPDENKGDSAY